MLPRDELQLKEDERRYNTEKEVHRKELKRCQCEENSVFFKEHLPVLHDRCVVVLRVPLRVPVVLICLKRV